MQEPSKQEVMEYVADMAEQLAAICRAHDPHLAAVLRVTAKWAREPDDCTNCGV